jgi:uncharacterized membrane protein YphA (DoxX/SURF4 family)
VGVNIDRDPRWVDAVLEQPWLFFLAKLMLTSAYLVGGVFKLTHFAAATAEQAHFGLQPAPVWAATAFIIELGGSLLILSGRFVWLGAGALGALTAIATFAAKPFWRMTGAAQFAAFNGALEDLGLIAGFVLVAILSQRRRSIKLSNNQDSR